MSGARTTVIPDSSISGSNCHTQSSTLLPSGPLRIYLCRNVLKKNYDSFKRLLVNSYKLSRSGQKYVRIVTILHS